MPRPDISEERIEQILDAFGACVARYGLDGTTLEMVADEAGVARSLIRHYLGNRETLLVAWAKRSVARYRGELAKLVAALPRRNPARRLIDYLFLSDASGSAETELVMDLLVASSGQHDECRVLIAEFIEEFIQTVSAQLAISFPSAPRARSLEVASGVVAISLCAESLGPLRLPGRYATGWKRAARRLVDELGAEYGL